MTASQYCPDCLIPTQYRLLYRLDAIVEEVGLCPECGRVTVDGDLPIERDEFDNYLDEGEFE